MLYTHISMLQCALPLPSLARDGHLFFNSAKKSLISLSLSCPIGITTILSLSSTTDQKKSHLSLSRPIGTAILTLSSTTDQKSLMSISLILLAQQYHHYHPQQTKKSLISLSLVLLAQQYRHYHPQLTIRSVP